MAQCSGGGVHWARAREGLEKTGGRLEAGTLLPAGQEQGIATGQEKSSGYIRRRKG